MKFIVFRTNNKSKYGSRGYRLNFERLLFILFVISFTLLVLIQAAMTNPSVRTFLSTENEFEGTPLGVEEFFYNEGTIALRLLSSDSDSGLKVLVNGDEAAVFNESVINLDVKDGDVVEIDGSSTDMAADVQIISKSDNILTDCVGSKVSVRSNIRKITDIKVK